MSKMSWFSLLLLSFGYSAHLVQARPYILSVPAKVPANASLRVDPSFPNFAFEEASFIPYLTTGNNTPNTFTQNLLKSVFSRTGGTPIFRVGGTTGDYTTFDASQTAPVLPAASLSAPDDLHSTTVGPSFFDAFKNLPGAQYILQVPMAKDNRSNAVEYFQSAWQAAAKSIQAIEVGNEPDLYANPPTPEAYVAQQKEYIDAITTSIPDFPAGPFFEASDVAIPGNLAPQQTFPLGLNADGRIKTYAGHFYPHVFQVDTANDIDFDLQTLLMDHSAIVNSFAPFKANIAYMKQNTSSRIPYALTEVGNSAVVGPEIGIDLPERNNLGSALWGVDYNLYAMSIGIKRVHMQQIIAAAYQHWLPVEIDGEQPQVRPNFYSQVFTADFIGNSSKAVRVANLPIGGANSSTISAYAAYENGTLARVAIINFDFWTASTTNSSTPVPGPNRHTQDVKITLPVGVKSARVERLTAPGGAYANSSLTWSGMQWTYPSGQDERVIFDAKNGIVRNGTLTVCVNATEAVMLHMDSKAA